MKACSLLVSPCARKARDPSMVSNNRAALGGRHPRLVQVIVPKLVEGACGRRNSDAEGDESQASSNPLTTKPRPWWQGQPLPSFLFSAAVRGQGGCNLKLKREEKTLRPARRRRTLEQHLRLVTLAPPRQKHTLLFGISPFAVAPPSVALPYFPPSSTEPQASWQQGSQSSNIGLWEFQS